ncbi:hypothetical protein [Nitrosomonas sp.]|uniref:hypothetical protein n=1 Tax=Nitrosomonas sp. TaxID=42353 RepID=UPI0028504D89|nr:hypothetical protein [Nitrosomonas sp.]MDR4513373.1 hypothetical protein [Nitrosomonas sp.]
MPTAAGRLTPWPSRHQLPGAHARQYAIPDAGHRLRRPHLNTDQTRQSLRPGEQKPATAVMSIPDRHAQPVRIRLSPPHPNMPFQDLAKAPYHCQAGKSGQQCANPHTTRLWHAHRVHTRYQTHFRPALYRLPRRQRTRRRTCGSLITGGTNTAPNSTWWCLVADKDSELRRS